MREAGDRIIHLTDGFKTMGLTRHVDDKLYESYIKEESDHLSRLKKEPKEDQMRFCYVNAIDTYAQACIEWEALTSKAGIRSSMTVVPGRLMTPELSTLLRRKNEAVSDMAHFEQHLQIAQPWNTTTKEYKETKKLLLERKYRLALDRVERLVIQRLFELQKANLVSTGESRFSYYTKEAD